MSLLRIEGVGHRFAAGTAALAGVDLTLEAGEFLSILGPSGCGKSTLLRLVMGLERPTAGRILWQGAQPRIGVVFQDPTLMPWASVIDNVALPLRLAGKGRAEREAAARAAIALVGLDGFEAAVPRELSGGMRMRASIARAFVGDPQVLLMDEPFAALDEITRLRLDDELRALCRRKGLAVVFVTHSVFESVYLSDRVAVMTGRPGRVADIRAIAREDGATFRASPAYARQCAETSASLARAMGPSA
ncbi:ABC transporter ATP-binding protein [Zavarzinia aquatilis]|uniref:ABC transporter ATP-binding protein n=1 Tax=Zavarzinia aquatilis TaxID=2211142 RepID=UPI001FAFE409|nr:ABC transporter ATP-binding protein [Zavarzinia aquatilis]